jgi:hypothetical protein
MMKDRINVRYVHNIITNILIIQMIMFVFNVKMICSQDINQIYLNNY